MTEDELELVEFIKGILNDNIDYEEFERRSSLVRWSDNNIGINQLWHLASHFVCDADTREDPHADASYRENLQRELDEFIAQRS